ncbi:MAG: hypothetical protein ABJE95_21175 [Byssovorax sp.]
MSVRKASSTLTLTAPVPPLIEREAPAAERSFEALDWQGSVRLAADRALGLSAPRFQQHVRTGLLERALSLGADHREGPHTERPEVARRLLAHVDALAEAGLSFEGIEAFSAEAEVDSAGALWTLTLLFGCLDLPGAEEAFTRWIGTLDEALLVVYGGVVEIADALAMQPSAQIRVGAASWLGGPSALLAAVAMEMLAVEPISGEALARLGRREEPLVVVAFERLLTRSPVDARRPRSGGDSWVDIGAPALAYEIVKARILAQDFDSLIQVRQRDARALGALGPYAIDVLALAGDATDAGIAREIVLGLPTTPGLLDAMGRAGLPALFPRLLAATEDDELDDEAHAALETALGPTTARPSRAAWEQGIAALPRSDAPARFRGGKLHTAASVLEEMGRPSLSASDLRRRADELFVRSGKRLSPAWDALGVPLSGALSELARLAR